LRRGKGEEEEPGFSSPFSLLGRRAGEEGRTRLLLSPLLAKERGRR